jgi:hypothetical protein
MRKAILVLVLLCVFSCLFAQESVTVDLSGMDEQEKLAFMFFYGYEAIMQKACKGAFLALDPDMNYIGGWRTDQTPEDFCTNIPVGVITTMQVLPMGVAKTLFLLLGDRETVAKLEGLNYDGIYAVCMFLPYEGLELEAPAYNYGKRLLEDEAIRHGLNPEDFFAFMQKQGISEESLVYTMYSNTATASEIVLDALGMMQVKEESVLSNAKDVLLLVCAGCIGVMALIGGVWALYSLVVRKKLSRAEALAQIDKHNKEVDS